jgi:anhydro-N-acetylmuramic acid kinase
MDLERNESVEHSKDVSSYVVGMMSGTSLDGVDAALVRISSVSNKLDVKLIHFIEYPFSAQVKEKLMDLCDPNKARIQDISAMNMFLGDLFATAALKVIKEGGITPEEVLLISSHGQTIFHQPHSVMMDNKAITSTLQIGDIGVIAERTGVTTVGDFRTRDMAVGGQGAPLVPYADFVLFREDKVGRILANIGGIANITVLPKNCNEMDVVAYDTGPGNMIMDAFTKWATDGKKVFDDDGQMAARGKIDKKWLKTLLDHEYFKQSAPKSTGREMFGTHFAKKLWNEAETLGKEDKIATITELTAITLVMEINKYVETSVIQEILVSGGGRYNQTLMSRIRHHLPDKIKLNGIDNTGMPANAKEAITFALLGYQCYHKKTNNIPSATGAHNKVVMGKIAW